MGIRDRGIPYGSNESEDRRMNAIIPTKLTARQVKSIEGEIRKQCVQKTAQYEFLLDCVAIYVLHTEFGFGKERLERFYDLLFDLRQEMQERYEGTDADDIAEYAMFSRLKDDGINMAEMFNKHEHRFVPKVNWR